MRDGRENALGKRSSSSAVRNSNLHALLGTGTFCQHREGRFFLSVLTSAEQVCIFPADRGEAPALCSLQESSLCQNCRLGRTLIYLSIFWSQS